MYNSFVNGPNSIDDFRKQSTLHSGLFFNRRIFPYKIQFPKFNYNILNRTKLYSRTLYGNMTIIRYFLSIPHTFKNRTFVQKHSDHFSYRVLSIGIFLQNVKETRLPEQVVSVPRSKNIRMFQVIPYTSRILKKSFTMSLICDRINNLVYIVFYFVIVEFFLRKSYFQNL